MVTVSKTENPSSIFKNRAIAGESIGEVLVATLISSLGLLMLALMISTASKMVTSSRSVMDNYIKDEVSIVTADSSSNTKNGSLTFRNGDKVRKLVKGVNNLNVSYYQITKVGDKAVTAYKKQIPPSS